MKLLNYKKRKDNGREEGLKWRKESGIIMIRCVIYEIFVGNVEVITFSNLYF